MLFLRDGSGEGGDDIVNQFIIGVATWGFVDGGEDCDDDVTSSLASALGGWLWATISDEFHGGSAAGIVLPPPYSTKGLPKFIQGIRYILKWLATRQVQPDAPTFAALRVPPARAGSHLPDELLEEILLRVPPDDPRRLVLAALMCRRWCRVLSGAGGFPRRYRHFHRRSPPMLGFICRRDWWSTLFLPTSSFRLPRACLPGDHRTAIDARHGHLLLHAVVTTAWHRGRRVVEDEKLVVASLVAGGERAVPMPRLRRHCGDGDWNAAVLCAAAGCDHLDCPRGGPFAVVFLGTCPSGDQSFACVYSSESGSWISCTHLQHTGGHVMQGRCALVRNALYFVFKLHRQIMEYDLGRQELSVIAPPAAISTWFAALFPAEDGGLGFATVQDDSMLHMWSGGSNGGWAQHRVIEMQALLPGIALSTSPHVLDFADGARVIFVWAPDVGVFSVDLNVQCSMNTVVLPRALVASASVEPSGDASGSSQT
ncbi:hypothetical protein ACP4OV_012076 [Aristida adscensionis]